MTAKQKNFFLCYFESTRQCNINCRYCMTKSPGPSKKTHAAELSTDEIKDLVIDEVKKYCPNAAIAFSGGEHLLRKDAFEILEYTAKQGLWSFINTNGKLLEKETVKKIKQITKDKTIFVFSLNSLNPDTHKWSRDDSLNTIVKAAKLCQKEKVNFFFILTISKNNLATLKETVKFLKSQGIPVLRSPFVPRGMGKAHPELLFTKEDMKNIIHPALREYPLSYVSYAPFFASPEFLENKWKELKVEIGQLGCQAAKGFIGISAEGDVSPCVHLLDSEVMCGNVKTQPLTKILAENEIMNKIRDRNNLKGKCGICRYKHTCGGCRAIAYYKTGDYLAEDHTCFFEPIDENTVSEHEKLQNNNTLKFIDFIKKNKPWSSLF
ncbi:MAG: radical SAM protein [Elusimicrobia bacterium]|nr:radical SAM protein [Elusimicrobiota bacterium]